MNYCFFLLETIELKNDWFYEIFFQSVDFKMIVASNFEISNSEKTIDDIMLFSLIDN